jgi:hypothetical protein
MSRPQILECGDLSPLSDRLFARSLALVLSWYAGAKAATCRRTPNPRNNPQMLVFADHLLYAQFVSLPSERFTFEVIS